MPITCVWLGEAPDRIARPGEMFHVRHRSGAYLSKHYLEHVAPIRRPIWVCLPLRGGTNPEVGIDFCIDSHPTSEPDAAWTVTIDGELVIGEQPPITVAPSIDALDIYHGFLTAGILSDDIG